MTASRSSIDGDGDDEDAPAPRGRIVLLVLTVLCALGAVAGLTQLHSVERYGLKAVCQRLAGAVERRDQKAVAALVDVDYRDGRGFDRDHLLHSLFLYLDAHGFTHVTPVSLTIDQYSDDRALVTAKLWLTQADPPPRGRRDAVQLDLSFKHRTGGWRLTSVEDWQVPEDDLEQDDSYEGAPGE